MAFALSDNLIIHKGFRLVYNDEGVALGWFVSAPLGHTKSHLQNAARKVAPAPSL